MTDIQLIKNDTQVQFYKKLYHESEVVLARCYNFHIDSDSGTITATIANTWKQAMYNFIALAFKNFSESLDQKPRRDAFYSRLDEVYSRLDEHVSQQITEKLPYGEKLYVHQRESVRFAFFNQHSFLALAMRLGKSICAASLSRVFQIKRTIIICPAVAKMGWFRDLTGFWGFNQLYFTVLDAAKSKTFIAFQERFVIVNFDVLDKFMPHLLSQDVGHIIIDECHRLKATGSNRFKNVEQIVKTFPHAKITMLSGTPIPNRFNDLFAYFKLTGHYLGESYKKFTDEFTIKTNARGGEKVTGAKNIADLKVKMANFMIVKSMEDCFDMPEDIISRYTFEMDDWRDEYNKIIDEMVKAKEIRANTSSIHTLNIITCKAKIPGIIEALEDIIAEVGKVVVFGTYKEPLQMLQDHFRERCLKIVGGVSSYDRDQYKQRFNRDPEIQVMLCNFEAGGEALDLSAANDVFYINFPFTVKEMNQSKSRVKHPEKRTQHTRLHYTFCEDSVDEHIYDIVVDKNMDVNALLHDGKDVATRENIAEILIKKILKKDDITFSSPFSKGKGVAPAEEATQGPLSTAGMQHEQNQEAAINQEAMHDQPAGGQPAFEQKLSGVAPKYYLCYHPESDCLFIENESEVNKLGDGDGFVEIIFYHESIDEVIITGKKEAERLNANFNESFVPNGSIFDYSIPGSYSKWINVDEIKDQIESFDKLHDKFFNMPPPPIFD